MKILSWKWPFPEFRFQLKACCTPSSLYQASVQNFVYLRLMIAKRRWVDRYIGTFTYTHCPMNFWPPFGPWGPQYQVLCPKSCFQLLRASIPSTQQLQNEINFFHLGDTSSQRVKTQALLNVKVKIIQYFKILLIILRICVMREIK